MKRALLFITLMLVLLQGRADNNFQFFASKANKFEHRHISMEDGLPSNAVRNIVQDKFGYLWLGTDNGLCRYDGIRVQTYRIAQNNSNQYISALLSTDEGILAGTEKGVFVLRYHSGSFEHLPLNIHSTVTSMTLDKDGGLWISTSEDGVWHYTFNNKQVHHYVYSQTNGFVAQVYVDNANQVWAVSNNASCAVGRLNRLHDRFEKAAFLSPLPYNSLCMLQTRDGRFWLGTWEQGLMLVHGDGHLEQVLKPGVANHIHTLYERSDNTICIGCDDGLICYDAANGQWSRLLQQSPQSDRFVYSITSDTEGGLWLGTFYGGVFYVSPIGRRFDGHTADSGLKGNVISRFCEDQQGFIWIASDDGGIMCYSPQQQRLVDYPHRDELGTVNAHALALKGNELWIGTYTRGVYVLNTATGQLRHYGHDKLRDASSYAIYHDSEGRTWVATMEGFNLYHPESDGFQHIRSTGALAIDIDEDSSNRLWLATQGAGLWCYSPNSRDFKQYTHKDDDEHSLPNDQVNCTMIDAGGRLWIGTLDGLCCFDAAKKQFTKVPLNVETGNVMSIIEDQGVLWLSTDHGIVKYDPSSLNAQRFNRYDGLVGEQCQPNAGMRASDGRIFFGSTSGFNMFYPYKIKANNVMPPVYITSLELMRHEEHTAGGLPIDLAHTEELTLDYSDARMLTLSFASLSYCSPAKNQYAYMLEGFDRDWNYVGNQHRATYTNIPSGTYVFHVKATNNDGIWSDHEATLRIVVCPPFWWSWYAKLFYLLLIVAAIWLYVQYRLKRAESRHQREMREARLQFFTMIAHEIRTPVSLIIGPLEKIMKRGNASDEMKVIDRNAHRLLELVNQLLDFRKVEQHSLVMHFAPQNLHDMIAAVSERFAPTFEQSGKRFTVEYPDEHFTAMVDKEAMTKVVSNLLTNANKYTKDEVRLTCQADPDGAHFRIVVADNGTGIREEDRKRIFEPFFQAQDNKPGTGIGLNIVKNIIDRHHGHITVDSEVGRGSVFTIILPVKQEMTAIVKEKTPYTPAEPATAVHAPADAVHPTMLIVDDSEDMVSFLRSNFSEKYNVITAGDGIEALDLLGKHEVNIIISDWMMPRMDGAVFCREVRKNALTSHIPFVLLTAKTDDASKVEGMDVGADAYIEKPFSVQYLEACIRNMLEMRRMLIDKFSSQPLEPVTQIASNPTDNDFLVMMNKVIEENFSNPDLNVNFLAEQLNISRSGLFAKIKTLADITPNEMIQLVRLKRAAQLLQEHRHSVSEVGYMVGFSNPSYFSKCFQKQFGIRPTDYMNHN